MILFVRTMNNEISLIDRILNLSVNRSVKYRIDSVLYSYISVKFRSRQLFEPHSNLNKILKIILKIFQL